MKTLPIGPIGCETINQTIRARFAIAQIEAIQLDPEYDLDKPERRALRDDLERVKGEFQDMFGDDEFWNAIAGESYPEVWDEFVDLMHGLCPDDHYFGKRKEDCFWTLGVWPVQED